MSNTSEAMAERDSSRSDSEATKRVREWLDALDLRVVWGSGRGAARAASLTTGGLLHSIAGFVGANHSAAPGNANISYQCDLSLATIRRHLKRAREVGLIATQRVNVGTRRENDVITFQLALTQEQLSQNAAESGIGQTTLYRYFDSAGSLLYVGITANYSQRHREHHSDRWWGRRDLTRDTVRHGLTRDHAEYLEALAIENEDPLENKQARSQSSISELARRFELWRRNESRGLTDAGSLTYF